MENNKIYIAGCGGMLGAAFYRRFCNDYELKCTDIDVNEDWLSYLDFTDKEKYYIDVASFKPDFLFHLGAFTDLEFCEMHPDETYITNTLAVENAVEIANSLGIPILYISTAGIFDGKKDQYDDWDTPNPLDVYARAKYMGERFVVENATQYLICRAGWMMGGGPKKDKKFVNKIIIQIKNGAKELFVVSDKDGTPTYTEDFAANVKLLVKNNMRGVYNLACSGMTSRLEVAREIVKELGLEQTIKINAVDSSYFSKEYFATRPACERLINKKLDLRGLNIMRDWKIALKEYIDEYYR